MLLTMWGIVMRRKKYRLWQSCMVMLLLIQSLKGNPLDLKAIYSEQISTETNKALEQIAQDYEEITEVITIGYSTTKQTEIKALKLGKGEKSILINGTHHGREALNNSAYFKSNKLFSRSVRREANNQWARCTNGVEYSIYLVCSLGEP